MSSIWGTFTKNVKYKGGFLNGKGISSGNEFWYVG